MMTETSSFYGSASIEACFQGDRSVECVVPQSVPEIDEIFTEVINLWADGFDTSEIAEACNLTGGEAEAYRLVNHYLDLRYSKGWGARS